MALKKKTTKKKIIKKKTTKKPTKKTIKGTAKKIIKKPLKKKLKPTKKSTTNNKEPIIGKVTHYFPHVQAAVIKIKLPLENGKTIKIKGHTTDFTQTVTSMQIDRVAINKTKKGDEIGLKVESRVRQGDLVYIV